MRRGVDFEEKNQTLIGHLTELRVRLVYSAYILVIATAVCYGFSGHIFDFIRAPIAPYLPSGGLIYTGPMDKFIAHIKLSFVCGILLSCPFWLYQVWKFVSPGLYEKEKKYTFGFIFTGTGLFLGGVAFAYLIVFPMAFKFLMTYGGDVDKPMISIDQYMGFFTQVSLVFGLAFELPLIIVILGMLGLVSHAFLKEKRRYAIMGIAVVAAVITPPDLLSMVLMLVPMVILYELGVVVVGIFERRRLRAMVVNERE